MPFCFRKKESSIEREAILFFKCNVKPGNIVVTRDVEAVDFSTASALPLPQNCSYFISSYLTNAEAADSANRFRFRIPAFQSNLSEEPLEPTRGLFV